MPAKQGSGSFAGVYECAINKYDRKDMGLEMGLEWYSPLDVTEWTTLATPTLSNREVFMRRTDGHYDIFRHRGPAGFHPSGWYC